MPVKIYPYKVTLIGGELVGKTSLMRRLVAGEYADSLKQTIGADFYTKSFVVGDNNVRLQMWDTAGQERFASFLPMYTRGANAILICVDPAAEEFPRDKILGYIKQARSQSTDAEIFVVITKTDLVAKKEDLIVLQSKLETLAQENNFDEKNIFLTSAKKNTNVTEAFTTVGQKLLANDPQWIKRKNADNKTMSEKIESYLTQQIARIGKAEAKTSWFSRFMNWLMKPLLKKQNKKVAQQSSKKTQFETLLAAIKKNKSQPPTLESIENVARLHRHKETHWKSLFRSAKQKSKSLKEFQKSFPEHQSKNSI